MNSRSTSSLRHSTTPFLFVNMAMTADGKIATTNRKISSFSSRRDRTHLMELRTLADAVMAGARTVDLNPVTLGPGAAKYRRLRKKHRLAEYNLRVIVSGSGTIDPEAVIFKQRFSPIIILTTARAGARLKRLREVADEVMVCGEREIDFRKALRRLHSVWGVKRLLCEGGGELNDALFRAGLVDELHLTISPKVFGGERAPTIVDGLGLGILANAVPLRLTSAKRFGPELFLVYHVPRHRPKRSVPPRAPAAKADRKGG